MEQITAAELQPKLTKHFAKLINEEHLAHAYIFAGPQGVGKKELALWIAAGLYCPHIKNGEPCLKCTECKRIMEGNQPDVVFIAPEGLSIKVEQIRFLKEEFSKSGVESNRKFFIIQDAEKMTTGAANSLLKFLEEPSGQVTAVLLTTAVNQLLPTVISRCQLLELPALTNSQMTARLEAMKIPKEKALVLGRLTDSVQLAQELAQNANFEELCKNVCQWYLQILQGDWRCFVDVQAKLLPLLSGKKDEQLLLDLIVLLAKDLLLLHYSQKKISFTAFNEKFVKALQPFSTQELVTATELILGTRKRLAVNVSFQNVIEALTLELCRCYHG
ncbi:DNA polymerase III delta prime subunit [Liquorilactobacillus sucicola DSM 21376 = JCM 15457]|uniref:DNA polymerase III subunit delta n=1 Tax=Liquorilactobacillus sucicola DSM 21376 = JCM 15457 TaxID=1423806 RepID=A0A023CVD5_9LACO|nr:DNA polymerase III subunit delta' [Liquorilactobacillus sucicola]KRN05943.1 DNA polymerase III subunit delta [Liquorilactobacillus sucicola DSM 21376 = JCM 15457]GAJ25853.1 DNA polymerase III delta prime subunit [Liquorilactobacillus sucicola DSM 21376 = JCM 15457]